MWCRSRRAARRSDRRAQVHAAQIAAHERGAAQDRAVQVRALEVDVEQRRAGPVGARQRHGRVLRRTRDFGVFGTENWGPGEVRGNAMRDLASVVCKLEMLPWDEWGPMEDSYRGKTGDDFDLLIDQLAAATTDPDEPELKRIYEQLAVPASMIH